MFIKYLHILYVTIALPFLNKNIKTIKAAFIGLDPGFNEKCF